MRWPGRAAPSCTRPTASVRGRYRVTVTAHAPADAKNPYAPPRHLINPIFGDVQTSGLAVQVVENPAPGAYDFNVTK